MIDSSPQHQFTEGTRNARTHGRYVNPVEKTYEIAVNNNVAANDNYVYLTTPKYNQDDQGNTASAAYPQHCRRLYARECSDEGVGSVLLRQERHLLMG